MSGPYPTHRTFVLTGWDDAIGHLANTVLSAAEVHMLEQIVSYHDSWLESERCYLAHGDFSGRHIFQEHGHYTGIIDFGDSKGVDGWYDLGYFHMRDGGPLLPYRLESALLRGYGEIVPLPSDYEQHICFASLLIAVTAIAHTVQNYPPDRFTQHQIKTLRHDLAALF